MEDGKKVYKFYGKPGEDFQLGRARNEAALQAKEVMYVVESDLASSDASDEPKKSFASASRRKIIILRLGDRSLRHRLKIYSPRHSVKLSPPSARSNTTYGHQKWYSHIDYRWNLITITTIKFCN